MNRRFANPLGGFKLGPMNRRNANPLGGFKLGPMMAVLLEFCIPKLHTWIYG
jgi:hypothetical protein